MANVLVDGVKNIMQDLKLSINPFNFAEVGLFTGATVITHATVIGDLTEVTGTGYARQPLTGWLPSVLNALFKAYSTADIVTFGPAGASDWTVINGWFWYSTGAGLLIRAANIVAPITLAAGESYAWAPSDTLEGV